MPAEDDRALPIVYVRGFAGKTATINKAVDDPLYGFNEGAVHVRVGRAAMPQFYQFEGPLLRLLGDFNYQLKVAGDQLRYLISQAEGTVPWKTVWVHRFYDSAANTFSYEPTKFILEDAARDLFTVIKLILAKTGAPRVHLVAHSMGGLICRSLIQQVIPEADGPDDAAVNYIDKVFTYGTPHGGIEFSIGFGLFEKLRDLFDIGDAAIFGRQRMYEYLTPKLPRSPRSARKVPKDWRATTLRGFPPDRMFCLVGTNPQDYAVAFGLSSTAVGVRSDGLVQIDNALVDGAQRAFVHRSHSGRYGMVNSEEGYQNLCRFLFGDLRVQADLVNFRLPERGRRNTSWQLDVQLSIRGLPIVMNEQTAAHHCPIQVPSPTNGVVERVPLLTTFLASRATKPGAGAMRYALHLRLNTLAERNNRFEAIDHLEQIPDFEDSLIVDVNASGQQDHPVQGWAAWNSEIGTAIRDWEPGEEHLLDLHETPDGVRADVALPSSMSQLGASAAVRLTVLPW